MLKAPKVCIYSPSEEIWGGGQIYIENLCRYMNEHDLEACIATSEPETFSCPTIKIPSVSSKSKRLTHSFSFSRQLKKSGIQAIVLNDLSSLWLAPVFKLSGLKTISLLHLYLQKKNNAGLGHHPTDFNLLRLSSYFCDEVFSVNKDNLKNFPVKVQFVGNFISPWFFGKSDTEKAYDLAIISRLSKEKNIPLFIKLVSNLNKKRPIKALILGQGEEKELIEQLIEQYALQDVIDLKDWANRDELPQIYDSIKCFAITSYHEGFATTLLEAHARGIPAISTKTAGFCGEFILGFNHPTGLVFNPEDIENLTFQDEVLKLIENSNNYYDNCINKAKLFSEDKVLGKITSSIKLILNR